MNKQEISSIFSPSLIGAYHVEYLYILEIAQIETTVPIQLGINLRRIELKTFYARSFFYHDPLLEQKC